MGNTSVEGVLDAVGQAAADIGGAVLHAVGLTTDGAEVLVDEAGQAVGGNAQTAAPAPGAADAPGDKPA